MSIEKNFDISFVADLALREKQIQQVYRPIIAVHKWFARRPGTLFRALMLAEFGERPLRESFFQPNSFPSRLVADPFMGGGTPMIEANRLGCDVQGFDINPMAAWIVNEEIGHLDIEAYQKTAASLIHTLRADLREFYLTDCPLYGDKAVPVKYFIWVKEIDCDSCRGPLPLHPGYLLSEDARHPLNVLICASCGELNEIANLRRLGACHSCDRALEVEGSARRGKCTCRQCGTENRYPRPTDGPPRHRLVAIEYYNPARKAEHKGRFFKKPDANDLKLGKKADARWKATTPCFVPEQEILPGDETDRLHRWGYSHYRDLFNNRQLLGLELSARLIAEVKDERIRHALATNFSDMLRYQNMLCRYDRMALKSLDIFSVHGFPVGLVQCESNLLGIIEGGGTIVGSGGWTNVVDKYTKAKRYCDAPFEIRRDGSRKLQIPIVGEWIGEARNGARPRKVSIQCKSSTEVEVAKASLDAVFTDPPYFGNVQYAELMDFCYVWLRQLVGTTSEGFHRGSTRAINELTGNLTEGRGLEHFTEGLASVYINMARGLKPRAPLVFTFHHNKLEAYTATAVAILDAELTCTASIPCPAEMGGSIHIHGTASSIIDTVFVCRTDDFTTDTTSEPGLGAIVTADIDQLRRAQVPVTLGDTRCITFGHSTRLAVRALRAKWDKSAATTDKLATVAQYLAKLGNLETIAEEARDASPVIGQFSLQLSDEEPAPIRK